MREPSAPQGVFHLLNERGNRLGKGPGSRGTRTRMRLLHGSPGRLRAELTGWLPFLPASYSSSSDSSLPEPVAAARIPGRPRNRPHP